MQRCEGCICGIFSGVGDQFEQCTMGHNPRFYKKIKTWARKCKDFESSSLFNKERKEEQEAHSVTKQQLEDVRKQLVDMASVAENEIDRLKKEVSNLQLIELGLRRDIMHHVCEVDGGGM